MASPLYLFSKETPRPPWRWMQRDATACDASNNWRSEQQRRNAPRIFHSNKKTISKGAWRLTQCTWKDTESTRLWMQHSKSLLAACALSNWRHRAKRGSARFVLIVAMKKHDYEMHMQIKQCPLRFNERASSDTSVRHWFHVLSTWLPPNTPIASNAEE
jgi:hypothetical protein